MIDAATLTGAQGIATGKLHAAVVASDDQLEGLLVQAGRASGDLVHALPFAPEFYRSEFSSPIADMRNSVANRSNAQVSCAAQFVYEHMRETGARWGHVDLASPAFRADRGTGFGVALLSETVPYNSRPSQARPPRAKSRDVSPKSPLEIQRHGWALLSALLLGLAVLSLVMALEPWSRELLTVRAAEFDASLANPVQEPAALEAPERLQVSESDGGQESALQQQSALALLEEHWGHRLPEILAQNQVEVDWLAAYPMASLPAWDEVSDEVLDRALGYLETQRAERAFLRLSGQAGVIDLDGETLRIEGPDGPLTDYELVRGIAAAVEGRLTAAWNQRWQAIENVIRARWNAGEVERHPILASFETIPEQALYGHSGSARGWTYRIVLLAEEEPALAASLQEYEALRRAAYDELESWLLDR